MRLRADVCLETGTLALYRPKVSNFSRVPLHPALKAELARMKEARGAAATDDAPVFLSPYGRAYRDFKCARAVAVGKAGLAGGLTERGFHVPRSCPSAMIPWPTRPRVTIPRSRAPEAQQLAHHVAHHAPVRGAGA
ncbi:MAG TPA: hypothetical protein VFY93_13820 [Planctomycetota bacterium]|nr:hypothetical protein [Planctomycetota bacterium]